jgi:hypothetical protein
MLGTNETALIGLGLIWLAVVIYAVGALLSGTGSDLLLIVWGVAMTMTMMYVVSWITQQERNSSGRES